MRRIIPTLVVAASVGSCDAGARPAPGGIVRAQASDDETRSAADKHTGHYRFSGGQKQRDAIETAIDEVVADMNVLARGIARDRLRESNPVPDRITIERDGDTIAIAFDERRYEAALDGSTTRVKGVTGDMVDYRVHVTAAKVRQSFVGDKGGRRNDLKRVGEDGLRLDVEVTSSSLPKPLRYRLSFRRE